MPFCTKCGNPSGPTDVFCGKCGARQAQSATASPRNPDFLGSLSARTASILCYIPVFGWIGCIIALAVPRFQHDRVVRFHAFQGLYIFAIWLIIDWVISPIFAMVPGEFHHSKSLLHLAVLAVWIFMLVKTSQDQIFRLPIVGELAERSVSEQRQ